jgi:LAO/AO transport system kinase
MELADLVVINKADLDRDAATRAQAQIAGALRIFSQQGRVRDVSAQVIQLSALKGEGLDRFWEAVTKFRDARAQSGQLAARRQHQALAWMWERIDAGLKHDFREQPSVRARLPQLTDEVEAGRLPASTAARQLLDAWRNE